ncbi:Histidine kinase-, DNA gyrase B-, and HSP90-like ATPase, partial [Streptococcus gallolyticus]
IQVYTQIQQLRFGERVHYNCIIDPELNPKEIYLLPLLIQPLIENAISHGLESVAQNGFVTLAISLQEPNTLCISVSDNGVGIEPAKLARIQEDISKNDIEDTSHIGLKNVHNRIKQYYGDQYGLFISSIKGQGTIIKLLFPLQKQVDDDN